MPETQNYQPALINRSPFLLATKPPPLPELPDLNDLSETPTTETPNSISEPHSAKRLQLLKQFTAETKLKFRLATECLIGANWDYQGAIILFNEHKHELVPADFSS